MLGLAIEAADTTNKRVSNGKAEEARDPQQPALLNCSETAQVHFRSMSQNRNLRVALRSRCAATMPPRRFKEETSMQGIFVALSLSVLCLLVAQLLEYVVHSTHEPRAGLFFVAFSKGSATARGCTALGRDDG